MRIGINAVSAYIGGGVTYLHHLLLNLIALENDHSYIVFCTTRNRSLLNLPEHPRLEIVESPLSSLAQRLWYEQSELALSATRQGLDVLYAPAEIAPLNCRIPIVLGIQNPNVYSNQGAFLLSTDIFRLRALRLLAVLSAQKAYQVVFVSEWSRSFIAPKLLIAPDKQKVVHHGVSMPVQQKFQVKSNHVLDRARGRQVVLAVSHLYIHKNYEALIHAVHLLPQAVRESLFFIIAGKHLEPVYSRLRRQIDQFDLNDTIWLAGEININELSIFYQSASLFVQPSREETFGMTILEAMSYGLPVICSRSGAMPEVGGEVALYFDADDVYSLAHLIQQVMANPESMAVRASLGIERAKLFSWSNTVEAMVKIFQEIHGCRRENRNVSRKRFFSGRF
ncbi:MAG: glycosyltransferase family 4 protein [Desulfobulbaceae bacterium]|nr:glycosyltransferase family 4 protein [Desulfobulbaceae bacterium]